jgi:Glycosyltransferase family 87
MAGVSARLWAVADRFARYRWVVIAVWLAVAGWLAASRTDDGDWAFFRAGTRALLGASGPAGPGGLHLYASHPELQIGPAALVAALPFHWLPKPWDVGCARTVMCLGLLLLLAIADRLARLLGVPTLVRHRAFLLGGLLVVPAWVAVAVTDTHLDDVMVLIFAVAAAVMMASARPAWAGAMVGLAIASKPWGVVVAPVLLCSGVRSSTRAVAAATIVAVAGWLPFLIEPGAVTALWHFRLPVSASSGLTVFGVHEGPMPAWVRPTQLLVGVGLGVLAVKRGHWTGVLLVGFATRVALDPASFAYYDAAPMVAALVWDLSRSRSGIPVVTAIAAAGFALSETSHDATVIAVIRLTTCVVLILAVIWRGSPGEGHPARPTTSMPRDSSIGAG